MGQSWGQRKATDRRFFGSGRRDELQSMIAHTHATQQEWWWRWKTRRISAYSV